MGARPKVQLASNTVQGGQGRRGTSRQQGLIDYFDLKEMKGEFGLERRMSCCRILFKLILFSILLTLRARNCIWFIGLRWYFIFIVFRWRKEGFDYLLVMLKNKLFTCFAMYIHSQQGLSERPPVGSRGGTQLSFTKIDTYDILMENMLQKD